MKIKVLPLGKYEFSTKNITKLSPITNKEMYLSGVIEVDEEKLKGVINRTHKFSEDLKSIIELNESERKEIELAKARKEQFGYQLSSKFERNKFMDAYRKYQAAVNYGEIKRSQEVDEFIEKLKNDEVDIMKEQPKQLLYFLGQAKFNESGLEKD